MLEKAHPSNEKDVEALLKKARMLPEQQFLVMYETSLREPPTPEFFKKYMEVVKEVYPQVYEALAGKQSPAQFTNKLQRVSKWVQK